MSSTREVATSTPELCEERGTQTSASAIKIWLHLLGEALLVMKTHKDAVLSVTKVDT